MRKRNIRIQFWLNKKEADELHKRVKRSGLSREAYLRHLVRGYLPKDAPPSDYFAMMQELRKVGHSFEQIAYEAHLSGHMDSLRYDMACKDYDALVKDITEAVILPYRMKE